MTNSNENKWIFLIAMISAVCQPKKQPVDSLVAKVGINDLYGPSI